MTNNRWCSVVAHCNVLSIHHQLLSVIALIMIWTYWLRWCLIETRPLGKAEPNNIHALVALILLKFIHLVKWFISPAKIRFLTNIHMWLPNILRYYFFKQNSRSNNIKNLVPIHWHILSYFLLFPLLLLVSMVLTIINTCPHLCLTSLLAESICEHLVRHSRRTALWLLNPWRHCLAPCQIHYQPPCCLRCRLDYAGPHSSQANIRCPKCFQVQYAHHFAMMLVDSFDFAGI